MEETWTETEFTHKTQQKDTENMTESTWEIYFRILHFSNTTR